VLILQVEFRKFGMDGVQKQISSPLPRPLASIPENHSFQPKLFRMEILIYSGIERSSSWSGNTCENQYRFSLLPWGLSKTGELRFEALSSRNYDFEEVVFIAAQSIVMVFRCWPKRRFSLSLRAVVGPEEFLKLQQ
jgi:hypothetical protein